MIEIKYDKDNLIFKFANSLFTIRLISLKLIPKINKKVIATLNKSKNKKYPSNTKIIICDKIKGDKNNFLLCLASLDLIKFFPNHYK